MSFDAPLDIEPDDLTAPAAEILRGLSKAAPILFASPHSGTLYPRDLTERLCLPLMNLRRTEDAFVDDLFAAAPEFGATLMTANYARSYVDLNRDARELDPDMFSDGVPRVCGMPGTRVKAGLGCLPKVGSTGEVFYKAPLTKVEGLRRLQHVHDDYHEKLKGELERLMVDWPEAIMVDCHSMPSRQPGRPKMPDIVLGDRFGSSCSGRLTSLVERYFRRCGYSVARNAPYAGGYITRAYGRPKRGVHVLQIEINRGLYLDETAVEKGAGFVAVQQDMTGLIEALVEFSRQFCS